VVGAVLSLLALPLGHHTRAEVLSVLTHPLVRARWPDVDAEEWLTWCVDAGVVRGLDDEAFRGSYAEGARLYHWDQGLERVALGTLTEGTPLEIGGHLLFPPPISGTRARSAGRLVRLARSLRADTAWAATAELSLAEWVRFIGELVATYVVPTDEATGAALRACLAAMAARAEVEAGEAPIAYRVAHDLVVEALEGLRSRRGAELAGGVHVAPLRAGAIVPFPVMFVLGLDAGRFPAPTRETDLDLRPTRPDDPGYQDVAEAALDASPDQVDFVKRFGNQIYYGDASRLELLRAARAESAKILVVAIDDVDASLRTVDTAAKHFPHLQIYARARNRQHAYRLMDLGVRVIKRETFLSALDLTREVLRGLGMSAKDAARTVETFQEHDERRLAEHHTHYNDQEKMQSCEQRVHRTVPPREAGWFSQGATDEAIGL
jgi:voltage-gated potassium channel Kch